MVNHPNRSRKQSVTRFILEGEFKCSSLRWPRIMHCEIITDKIRIDRLKKLNSIVYVNGATLTVRLRKAHAHERVWENHCYASAIKKAERAGAAVYHVS